MRFTRTVRRAAVIAVVAAVAMVGASVAEASPLPPVAASHAVAHPAPHLVASAHSPAGAGVLPAAMASSGGIDFGIPPLPYDPTGSTAPYGSQFDISNIASKTKTTIDLDKLVVFTQFRFCLVSVLGSGLPPFESCCPDPTVPAACYHVDPPATSYDDSGNVYWVGTSGPSWVSSPKHVSPAYGTFPPQRVHLLAFGAIPVTATVHISQIRPGRYVSPLALDIDLEGTPLPAGTTIPSYSTSVGAPAVASGQTFFSTAAFIRGKVDIRISDVAVDGEPVDVGPDCRTSSPGDLDLTAPAGFYDGNADVRTLRGRPGELQTVAGSHVSGSVSIPAFTGCGSDGEDLDPLITGTVSTPTNPVEADLTVGLNNCGTPATGGFPCPPRPPDAKPPASAGAAGARAAAADATRLDSTQLAALARGLTRSTPAVRQGVLASLPSALRTALSSRMH